MNHSEANTISVIIPVYNGEQTIPTLITRLMKVLDGYAKAFEIILVNDGSSDQSWEKIQKLANSYPGIRGINLLRNYGQHNALLCGIRAARMNVLVTLDDDLQHPPEEIPQLVEKLHQGFDVVYGIPRKLPHSFWRNASSWLIKRMLALVMGLRTVKEISAFRAFRGNLRKAFEGYQSPGVIIDVLLSWATVRFASIQVNEAPREIGESNYTFTRLLSQALLILTGFSTIPLRFANLLGFVFTLVGLGIFIYVIVIYFAFGSIPGFPFLASIVSIFSGIQLLVLGIFGEYLARVFDRSMDRPTYIVEDSTDEFFQNQNR